MHFWCCFWSSSYCIWEIRAMRRMLLSSSDDSAASLALRASAAEAPDRAALISNRACWISSERRWWAFVSCSLVSWVLISVLVVLEWASLLVTSKSWSFSFSLLRRMTSSAAAPPDCVRAPISSRIMTTWQSIAENRWLFSATSDSRLRFCSSQLERLLLNSSWTRAKEISRSASFDRPASNSAAIWARSRS